MFSDVFLLICSRNEALDGRNLIQDGHKLAPKMAQDKAKQANLRQ